MRAAREVFSERGYDGASFHAIAERAAITRPAVNHYFASKRKLYQEVADQADPLISVAIDEAGHESTILAKLTAFITYALRQESEDLSPWAFPVTAILESQRHPELDRTESSALRHSREYLRGLVQSASDSGEFASNIDADTMTEALLVIWCGVAYRACTARVDQHTARLTETLNLLLAGMFSRVE